MDEEQKQFFNVIIEKTNQKLNSLQAQVIVLESQLQMAVDERDAYKKYVEGLPQQKAVSLEAQNAILEAQNAILELEKKYNAVLQDNAALQVQARPAVSQEQNETLAHEVRRLQGIVDKMS